MKLFHNCPYNQCMATPLKELIIERVRREGRISFRDYMETALYHPEYGYYTRGIERIGPEGDFYTSPHLHRIFGEAVGLQICEMLRHLDEGGELKVVEIGGGKGYLAEGVLIRLIEELGGRNIEYLIVEKNRRWAESQKDYLSGFKHHLRWTSSLDEISPFKGVILSNELFDAFPVHLIEYRSGFKEVFLEVRAGELVEVLSDIKNPALLEYINEYEIPEIEGYRTEVNLEMKGFLNVLSGVLREGFVLTIDYGYPAWEYYLPERTRGTLLCYHRHTVSENPYRLVGEQDITAHINFTSLVRWGREVGFEPLGYAPQGTFLISLGIDRLIQQNLEKDRGFERELPKIKGLLLGMGDTHKVLVQYKGENLPTGLSGFSLRNRLSLLEA